MFQSSTKKIKALAKKIGIIDGCNYTDSIDAISESGDYFISLFDGSLINVFYSFDSEDQLLAFSLSFLPNVVSEALFENDYSILQNYSGNYYLRIDYDPNSYRENIHTKIHMHTSLNKKDLRIPVNKIILPSEFLYFVLKNIYGKSDISTFKEKMIENIGTYERETLLSQDEKASFFLSNQQ